MNILTRISTKACGLALLALMTTCSLVECRPLNEGELDLKPQAESVEDPLVAMPSGIQQATYGHQIDTNPKLQFFDSERRIQYQVQESQQQQAIANLQGQLANSEIRQGPVYMIKPNGELVQQLPEYNNKPEYVSMINPPIQHGPEAKQVYPAELLIMDQNGETSKLSGDSQESNSPGQTSQELSNVARLITKSSGLPATILTEISIKDMPLDVLEKLKKDYGVKVVATRDRPGASLVINCDSLSQENSLCARQQAYTTSTSSSPQSFASAYDDRNSGDEKPQIPNQIAPPDHDSSYGSVESDAYNTRDREMHLEDEASSKTRLGVPEGYENDYVVNRGSSDSSDRSNQDPQGGAEYPSDTQAESTQGQRKRSQSERNSQQDGF